MDGSGGNQEVLLSDMSGKVLEKHLLQAGRNRMDVSRLPQGQYLLRGQFESCRFTKK
ncbi:MAG: T9SS type A sorting domain-containing protein [Paludibacteraceae bacterium]|nr:T9SS type A sorting domain-containing protein [Paludibacteraceae bacterium]